MAWRSRLAGWIDGRKSGDGTLELFREVFGRDATWAGKSVNLKTAMQVSTAFACARVIAEGIAMLPFKVMRQQGRSVLPAAEHPLYDKLMIAPNGVQTSFEFLESMALHLALCGNAYVLVNRVSRRVDEMWLLEPKWVTVRYRLGEIPTYRVQPPEGEPFDLSASDCWHVRGPSWVGYLGLEFIVTAREALGLAMAIEEGQARLQSQGVRPGGGLSVDGALNDEQYKKLRGWLERDHEGAANAGRTMIVDRAAKWFSMAMSNVDAQMIELRRLQIEEVCRYMRVMPIMVGSADKTATYASAEQMFIAHSVHTIGPWITRIEKSADKNLLTPAERQSGLYTKFNEKALQRMTAKDQMEFLARGALSGILTRNEGREKLDLNPIDGLDEPLAPANTFVGNPPEPPDKNDEKPEPERESVEKMASRLTAGFAEAIKGMPQPQIIMNVPKPPLVERIADRGDDGRIVRIREREVD